MSKETLNYYNNNANNFYNNTVNANFLETQNIFISKLKKGATILDFGCGSGRDTKYFLEKGFEVDAIDGSRELCKLASAYTGINVKNMLFEDLDEIEKYDGIWACAAILHLSLEDMKKVIDKMIIATKKNGIIYISLKYGSFVGDRNGRFYVDMNETIWKDNFSNLENVEIEKIWITGDVLPNRENEKWFNIILRKTKDHIHC